VFDVNRETKEIIFHRGNTGEVTFYFTGYDFTDTGAKALFSMKRMGTVVKNEVHDIVDNQIVVRFTNEDTDQLQPGTYEYDVTVVMNAVFEDDELVSGEVVYTTEDPIKARVKRTVGQF